jgi:hypothetical protein
VFALAVRRGWRSEQRFCDQNRCFQVALNSRGLKADEDKGPSSTDSRHVDAEVIQGLKAWSAKRRDSGADRDRRTCEGQDVRRVWFGPPYPLRTFPSPPSESLNLLIRSLRPCVPGRPAIDSLTRRRERIAGIHGLSIDTIELYERKMIDELALRLVHRELPVGS